MKKYKYREPPTPGGIEKIATGELKWFDTEMFANFNTGILEEYLEEKNRVEGFRISRWNWTTVLIGISLGTFFGVITEYVGLKVGIAISGGWYVAYLVGLMLRRPPTEVNIMSAATSAATYISTGFIFTFPAMYILAYDPNYAIGAIGKTPIFLIKNIPPLWIAIISVIVSGWLGAMYFILFRRLWLVDDPLHLPGFEVNVKLLDIANDMTRGAMEQAKRSIKTIAVWGAGTAFFTFLRDLPILLKGKEKVPILDYIFGGTRFYEHGDIMQPHETANYTFLAFGLIPIQVGIGWFMKFRVALLVSLGCFLTWFVVVPLAVGFHVPAYIVGFGFVDVNLFPIAKPEDWPSIAWATYRSIAVPIGIGAILGGGTFALIKMAPVFKTTMGDVYRAVRGGKRTDYIEGKGWYEWPLSHIPLIAIITFFVVWIVFSTGGYPILQSGIFAFTLVGATFFLGAIAVKTMGETGTEPVSGTSFIVLLILIGLFIIIGTPREVIAIMAIIGTTVFAGAISISGDIFFDFKAGLYMGNRPYHLMKAVTTAIIPGAIAGAIGASILSYGLATHKIELVAPQAYAFAQLTQLVFGGQSSDLIARYLAIGIGIGVFAEIMTGMGTAFGLGMYFPLSLTFPMLFGGALRDLWEKYKL
ncbi:MAG: OPT/YSL family transporter, partial [Candidatus Thermoplasmatota archaeon]